MQETQHTIAILPEKAKRTKVFSKRDIACASTGQTKTIKKSGRRAGIDDAQLERIRATTRQERKGEEAGKAKTPDVAIDFDEEAPNPPSLLPYRQTPPYTKQHPRIKNECKIEESPRKRSANLRKGPSFKVKAMASRKKSV